MNENMANQDTKFCKECGRQIARKAVICPLCGCPVEDYQREFTPQQIVINNTNQNQNMNAGPFYAARMKDKWVAFILCLFLGYFGAHKFYEERFALGVLYFLTGGLFFFGWAIDTIALFFKPNPYYVL